MRLAHDHQIEAATARYTQSGRVHRWIRSGQWVNTTIGIILALASLLMVIPFLWLFFGAFKTSTDIVQLPVQLLPRNWSLEGFRMIVEEAGLVRAYLNSLLVSAVIVTLVLFTSSIGGYAFARLNFPGRNLLFYFILATTMVPTITLLIPLYLIMMDMGVLDTYLALWIPAAISSFGVFLCRQFIIGIPLDYYDAAKLDGATDFAIYRSIILPLIRPVLAVLAIFTFMSSFNAYLWPLVVLHDQDLYTLPLVLVQASSQMGMSNYQAVLAGAVLSSIPAIIVYVIFQRHLVKGIALSGIKG